MLFAMFVMYDVAIIVAAVSVTVAISVCLAGGVSVVSVVTITVCAGCHIDVVQYDVRMLYATVVDGVMQHAKTLLGGV